MNTTPEGMPIPTFREWLMKLHADLTDLEMVMLRLPYVDQGRYREEYLPEIYAVQETIQWLTEKQPKPEA